MSRKCCEKCERPVKTCICAFISNIHNDVDVLVLQHPSEEKQTKGTVSLLAKSLQNCKVWVGEDFTQEDDLHVWLKQFKQEVYLLYPSEYAQVIEVNKKCKTSAKRCLIILDGTWKKAYRLFMLNPFLHHLPHLTLPEGLAGEYHIRKTRKANALSSLEACGYALQLLEASSKKYAPLFDGFKGFNQQQLAFRPDFSSLAIEK